MKGWTLVGEGVRGLVTGSSCEAVKRGVGIQLATGHASHLNCSDLHKSTLSISKSIPSLSFLRLSFR